MAVGITRIPSSVYRSGLGGGGGGLRSGSGGSSGAGLGGRLFASDAARISSLASMRVTRRASMRTRNRMARQNFAPIGELKPRRHRGVATAVAAGAAAGGAGAGAAGGGADDESAEALSLRHGLTLGARSLEQIIADTAAAATACGASGGSSSCTPSGGAGFGGGTPAAGRHGGGFQWQAFSWGPLALQPDASYAENLRRQQDAVAAAAAAARARRGGLPRDVRKLVRRTASLPPGLGRPPPLLLAEALAGIDHFEGTGSGQPGGAAGPGRGSALAGAGRSVSGAASVGSRSHDEADADSPLEHAPAAATPGSAGSAGSVGGASVDGLTDSLADRHDDAGRHDNGEEGGASPPATHAEVQAGQQPRVDSLSAPAASSSTGGGAQAADSSDVSAAQQPSGTSSVGGSSNRRPGGLHSLVTATAGLATATASAARKIAATPRNAASAGADAFRAVLRSRKAAPLLAVIVESPAASNSELGGGDDDTPATRTVGNAAPHAAAAPTYTEPPAPRASGGPRLSLQPPATVGVSVAASASAASAVGAPGSLQAQGLDRDAPSAASAAGAGGQHHGVVSGAIGRFFARFG